MITDYLKPDDLKDGWLYQICARNAHVGIWNSGTRSFAIRRVKFTSIFLCEEGHWDNEKFGTAKPLKEIEKAPDIEGQKLIDYLEGMGELHKIDFDEWMRIYKHKHPAFPENESKQIRDYDNETLGRTDDE